MTNREFFEMVMNGNVTEEVKAHAEMSIEKLDARNAKRASQPSKRAIENEPIKAHIREYLTDKEPTTASEIAKGLELTVQKVSALCRQMVNDGILTVTEVKVKGKGNQKAYSIG